MALMINELCTACDACGWRVKTKQCQKGVLSMSLILKMQGMRGRRRTATMQARLCGGLHRVGSSLGRDQGGSAGQVSPASRLNAEGDLNC